MVRRWLGATLAFGVLGGCGGGGGGLSDVGDQPDLGPIAVASVIGGGNNNSVRSGGVVVLSGKDSDGQDSPILRTTWSSADPSIVLEERTSNSVAFEAPNVAQATTFSFTVTVFDAEDQSDADTVAVTVVPAQDLDKFLSIDGADVGSLTIGGAVDFDTFTVRVTPVDADEPVGPTDTFAVTVDAVLTYADRNAMCASLHVDGSQCLAWENNAQLQLGSAGFPYTLGGVTWNAAAGNAAETVVTLGIPAIDVTAINQSIIDTLPPGATDSARDALLDPWRADTADITLTIVVTSAIAANVAVGGPGSATIPLGPANDVTVTAILDDASDALAIETDRTADAYYAAVDPDGDFITLSDWLVARGFATRAADGSVGLTQSAVAGTGEFAHAKYTNNFDLGFGRDMYTRVDEATGNVYSFVTNYPNLQNAIEGREEFVTVVMDYSPPGGLANSGSPDPKFTKFYVYVIDEDTGEQIRARSIDFDGRGLKYVPGVCIACHGGTVPTKGAALAADGYAAAGDTGATFLPWDLESFLYSDTDPAIPATAALDGVRTLDDVDPGRNFTRAAQEAQLRKLNIAALATYTQSQADETVPEGEPSRFAAVVDLLGVLYPTAVGSTPPAECNAYACLAGTFTDGAVPAGWADAPELYVDVYARHCRACHNQLENTAIQFVTSADFLANANVGDMVFRTGVMPLARLTMDRLWAGTDTAAAPVDLLRAALPDVNDEIPGGPIPRPAFASTNLGAVARTTDAGESFLLTKVDRRVDVTGEASLFFDALSWGLGDASADPEFPTCLQDPAALQDDGTTAALTPLVGADYCLALTASKAGFADATAVPLLVRAVADRPTEVLASTCAGFDDSTCVAVDEVTTSQPNPQVVILAQLATMLDPSRLLALADQDLTDGLDTTAAFAVDFGAGPTAPSTFVLDDGTGTLVATAETVFALDDLIAGSVGYRSGFEDGPAIEALPFTVTYAGGAVFTGTAEILIRAKSDSAPMLQILPNSTTVAFGGTTGGTFRVDDVDPTDVVEPPLLVTNGTDKSTAFSVTASPTDIGAPSGAYTYTANVAKNLNPGVIQCQSGGGFMGGAPMDDFTVRVTTGTPGDAGSTATGDATLALTLTTTVSEATVNSQLSSFASGNTCLSCHASAFFTATEIRQNPLWTFDDPGSSPILNSSNVTVVVHNPTGGRPTFDIAAALPDVETWIYECVP